MSDSLQPHGPARLLCPWDSPGKNTGMRCHFFLQGIYQTQGLNLGLLHCRQILYCLSTREAPTTGQLYLFHGKRVNSIPRYFVKGLSPFWLLNSYLFRRCWSLWFRSLKIAWEEFFPPTSNSMLLGEGEENGIFKKIKTPHFKLQEKKFGSIFSW